MEYAMKFNLPLMPTLESVVNTLNQSIDMSVQLQSHGEELLARIGKNGLSDETAFEVRAYLVCCVENINKMKAARKPYTDALIAVREKFTALENAVDPKNNGTPAFRCEQLLTVYRLRKYKEAKAKAQRSEQNFRRAQARILNRKDRSDEQKNKAIDRAKKQLEEKIRGLNLHDIKTQLIPQPVMPEGYVEIFKFWWENVGKGLPKEDLNRMFHPMLMYAKKQAAKGVLLQCECVGYVEKVIN